MPTASSSAPAQWRLSIPVRRKMSSAFIEACCWSSCRAKRSLFLMRRSPGDRGHARDSHVERTPFGGAPREVDGHRFGTAHEHRRAQRVSSRWTEHVGATESVFTFMSGVPTSIVSPSAARISSTVPSTGDVMSKTFLAASSEAMGSPSLTVAPVLDEPFDDNHRFVRGRRTDRCHRIGVFLLPLGCAPRQFQVQQVRRPLPAHARTREGSPVGCRNCTGRAYRHA